MKSVDLMGYLTLGLGITALGIGAMFVPGAPDLIGWVAMWLGGVLTTIASVAVGVLWGMQAQANEREDAGR